MTQDRDFKRWVRSRAARTGESYQTAWRQLRDGAGRGGGTLPALDAEVDIVLQPGLDADAVEGLRASLLRAITGRTEGAVVVDASGVLELSPEAAGTLVGALKRARASGLDVVLRSPSVAMADAMRRLRLDEVFAVSGAGAALSVAGLVPVDVGAVLAARRRSLGLTLSDAASRAGVPRLKLDLIERGAATVTRPQAFGIASGLRLDASSRNQLVNVASLSEAMHTEAFGDTTALPSIAQSRGLWLSRPPAPRVWFDMFAVDGRRIILPADGLERLGLHKQPSGARVSAEIPSGERWMGTLSHLTAAARERAVAVLCVRYRVDSPWFYEVGVVGVDIGSGRSTSGADTRR